MEIITTETIVSSGTSLSGCLVAQGGILRIQKDGWGEDIALLDRGTAFVSSGGILYICRVSSGGTATVLSSGYAQDVTVEASGLFLVSSGGSVHHSIVLSGGTQIVYADTMVAKAEVQNGGLLQVSPDGHVPGAVISQGGTMSVQKQGVAEKTKLFGSAEIVGVAQYTEVLDGGRLDIQSDGWSLITSVGQAGLLVFQDGAIGQLDTVYDGGIATISAGGTASVITVSSGGRLMVCSGGTATDVIENGGHVEVEVGADVTFAANSFTGLDLSNVSATVHSGTTATDPIANPGGFLHVFSGGIATGVVENGGYVEVEKDAEVSFVTNIINGLSLDHTSATVHSGTTLTDPVANPGGFLQVFSGGVATGIVENGGHVSFAKDADVTFVPNTINQLLLEKASATVHSGTIASDTTVNSFGRLSICYGGSADNTEIISGGSMHVSSGGIASNTTVNSKGTLCVYAGGTASDTTVNSIGTLCIYAGGTVENITVNYMGVISGRNGGGVRGKILVNPGGSVSGITVENGGRLVVSNGGSATETTVNSNGILTVESGGWGRATVSSGGSFVVENGGTAGATVNSGGSLIVENGGSVTYATINYGGTATGIILNDSYGYGSVTVNSGGTAINTTVISGASMFVEPGGCADGITMDNGYLAVKTGGSVTGQNIVRYRAYAYGIILNEGELTVCSGGTAGGVTVKSGGRMTVADGGSAGNITISSCGSLEVTNGGTVSGSNSVRSGGTATGIILCMGDYLMVQSGGIASNTILMGGSMRIAGGTAVNITLMGGKMYVGNGKLTGRMFFEKYADITMTGGTLDFDITQTEAGATALVNDLSIIQGTQQYTLTVSASQAAGIYSLADGATDFAGTISVKNGAGETVGNLKVGNTIEVGATSYSLALTGSELTVTVEKTEVVPTDLAGSQDRLSWKAPESEQFLVECSTDDFDHAVQIPVSGTAVDLLELPAGTYQWRVKAASGEEWAVGETFEAEAGGDDAPKVVQSNEDGNEDLFFASTNGTWEIFCHAWHVGSINDWTGTNEIISATGKGRIQNLFFGSADPNVLCLTDEDSGDSIFVDDCYSDLPESIAEKGQVARLYKIQEIRAGAGDDIVDMTSQKFEYVGNGLTIRGGDGDDVIWANKGDNLLFGDDGNDRIVGASGNDVIAGGIGNDRMHGGGNDDVFAFCENWGADTVEQLASGSVTLWFASGDESNWDSSTLTYTDGTNSVKVSGVAAEQVTLKFGDDGSEQFASLSKAGAFDSFTSQKIFEESVRGTLASL